MTRLRRIGSHIYCQNLLLVAKQPPALEELKSGLVDFRGCVPIRVCILSGRPLILLKKYLQACLPGRFTCNTPRVLLSCLKTLGGRSPCYVGYYYRQQVYNCMGCVKRLYIFFVVKQLMIAGHASSSLVRYPRLRSHR